MVPHRRGGLRSGTPLASWDEELHLGWAALHFIVHVLIIDVWFYLTHCALHWRSLYGPIHKFHHRFKAPNGGGVCLRTPRRVLHRQRGRRDPRPHTHELPPALRWLLDGVLADLDRDEPTAAIPSSAPRTTIYIMSTLTTTLVSASSWTSSWAQGSRDRSARRLSSRRRSEHRERASLRDGEAQLAARYTRVGTVVGSCTCMHGSGGRGPRTRTTLLGHVRR